MTLDCKLPWTILGHVGTWKRTELLLEGLWFEAQYDSTPENGAQFVHRSHERRYVIIQGLMLRRLRVKSADHCNTRKRTCGEVHDI